MRLLDHGNVTADLVVVDVAFVDFGSRQIQKESQEICTPAGTGRVKVIIQRVERVCAYLWACLCCTSACMCGGE